MPSTDRAGGAVSTAQRAPAAAKPDADVTMMKAVAVRPGVPDSMHLARLAEAIGGRDSRWTRRAGQGAAGRGGRDRQGDQRGRVRRRAAGLRLPGHRPRGLRPGGGGGAERHRAGARRLRRGHGAPSGLEHLRPDRHLRHDDRRRVLRARHQSSPRLPHRVLRRRRRVHRQDSLRAAGGRRAARADDRGGEGHRPGVRDPAPAAGVAAPEGRGHGRRDDRAARGHGAPAPRARRDRVRPDRPSLSQLRSDRGAGRALRIHGGAPDRRGREEVRPVRPDLRGDRLLAGGVREHAGARRRTASWSCRA